VPPAAAAAVLVAKATLVLVAALAAARVLQRAAAGARHLVWLAALGALLLVPVLALWAPARLAVIPAGLLPAAAPAAATAAAPAAAEPAPAAPARPGAAPERGPAPDARATPGDDAPTFDLAPVAAAGAPRAWSAAAVLPAALALWAAVALGVAGSLAASWLAVRRVVRRAEPLDGPDWRDPLYEVADRLDLAEPPRLVRSAGTAMPFACGLRRPVVVLPAGCDGWAPDRRRAVLLHELAHVRRRDLAGHTLARLVCAAYWFHPLVWTAARRLRAESERACDDLALACGARPADYAEHLLDIVSGARRGASPPAAALAMARRSEFEGRMLDILDPERPRRMPTRRQSAALVTALALFAGVVGAAGPAPAGSAATDAAQPPVRPAGVAGPRVGPAPRVAPAPEVAPSPGVRPTPNAEPSPDAGPAATATTSEEPPGEEPGSDVGRPAVALRVDVPAAPGRVVVDAVTTRERVVEASAPAVAERVAGEIGAAAADALADASADALADAKVATKAAAKAEARALVGPRARFGSAAPDDRAALLARVLRADTSAELRRVAAWGLARHADAPEAGPALAAALRGDRAPRVREMAAWALAEREGDAEARAALAAALRDADASVRATAAWALGMQEDAAAAGALAAALGDASPAVRARAAWALGRAEPAAAPPALVALLGDADTRTRLLAAWALFRIEDPAAAPALERALRGERDPQLQRAYVRALAALGERSVPVLRGLLESADPAVRAVAVRALAGGNAAGSWPWPWPQPRPYP
jgi:beta-lactamase regulating signal transducer with metallopeptidase domain